MNHVRFAAGLLLPDVQVTLTESPILYLGSIPDTVGIWVGSSGKKILLKKMLKIYLNSLNISTKMVIKKALHNIYKRHRPRLDLTSFTMRKMSHCVIISIQFSIKKIK